MKREEVVRYTWAMVAAALADDHEGLDVLADDLDATDARDMTTGLALVTARTLARSMPRENLLTAMRELLAERET